LELEDSTVIISTVLTAAIILRLEKINTYKFLK